jgi:NAD(P)-dependent dehydrogenase (short-subunit alcohol dehydrogenase family)
MSARSTDRWVLVGGGSGGIGRAICRQLADDGWNVALTYYRGKDSAAAALEEIGRTGREARAFQVDLTDAEQAATVVRDAASLGNLAGVVYAAGPSMAMDYIANLDPGAFAQSVDIDIKGCFNLVRPALGHLRESKGSVIALSTQATARYAKKNLLSSAPKAAIENIVKGIAVEEGRFGVRANTLAVGVLEGEGAWEKLLASGAYTEALLKAAKAAIPLGRFGTPDDIAATVRFLLSDAAAWITGQTIYVDGGYSA